MYPKIWKFKNPLYYQSDLEQESHAWNDGHNLKSGLNDKTVITCKQNSNGRFADSYRRFIQMYSNVVIIENYEKLENFNTKGILLDTGLDEDDWDGLISDFKNIVREKTKRFSTGCLSTIIWSNGIFILGK